MGEKLSWKEKLLGVFCVIPIFMVDEENIFYAWIGSAVLLVTISMIFGLGDE